MTLLTKADQRWLERLTRELELCLLHRTQASLQPEAARLHLCAQGHQLAAHVFSSASEHLHVLVQRMLPQLCCRSSAAPGASMPSKVQSTLRAGQPMSRAAF